MSNVKKTVVTSVRGLIGIIRGPASDDDKVYPGTKTGTEDIKGFRYKKMVGSKFLSWLTGYEDVTQFMSGLEGSIAKVGNSRRQSLSRIQQETANQLKTLGLEDHTKNLLNFLS
jgi:hypothetical protein